MSKRESFLLYTSFQPMFERLNDAEAGHLIKAIYHYVKTGEDMPISNEATNMAYMFIRNQLSVDNKKWEETIDKRREAGKRSGEARKKEQKEQVSTSVNFVEQEGTQKICVEHNVNVNVNENENVNVNENVTVNENPPLSDSQKAADELAELLFTSHRKEFPDYLSGKSETQIRKKLDGWAVDIEYLIRLDKKTPDAIRQVILWIKTPGNFWFHNIESGKKLREKFGRLYGQMSTAAKRPSPATHRIAADNVSPENVDKYFKEA